jgi:hypothetical protein
MKNGADWLLEASTRWHAHPDDYDPTDEQLWGLLDDVIAETIEECANACEDASSVGDVYAKRIRSLRKPKPQSSP